MEFKFELSQCEHAPLSPEEEAQMLADHEESERLQRECKHSHKFEDLDPEDGCIHCGYYSK